MLIQQYFHAFLIKFNYKCFEKQKLKSSELHAERAEKRSWELDWLALTN